MPPNTPSLQVVISAADVKLRSLIENLLDKMGCQINCFDSEQALSEFIKLNSVALFVVDLESSGFSDLSVIKQHRVFADGDMVPLILITNPDDSFWQNEFDDDDALIIHKPLNPGLIKQQLRFLIKNHQQKLQLINDRNRLIETQSIAHVGSWQWQTQTDVLTFSEESKRILRINDSSPIENIAQFISRMHLEDQEMFELALETCLEEKLSMTVECRSVLPDGVVSHLLIQAHVIVHDDAEIIDISGVIHDISERKKQEDQIVYLAFHDELTGLPNPRLFKERLDDSIDLAERYDQKVAALFFDLDRFKRINDTLGHTLGDQLIQMVAQRLVNVLRGTDCVSRLHVAGDDVPVARLGGDEFIVLITRVSDINDIAKIARRLVEEIKQPFYLDTHEIFLSASVGISVYPENGGNSELLLKNADSALHHAKKEGGDRFRFYQEDMNSTALDRLSLEADLRRALENEEFVLFYQPQVDGNTGKIFGVEGLIRWMHPQRGLVPPFHFIPMLEETGQIVDVGEWVLRAACMQQKIWIDHGYAPITLSVNLSVRQFMQAGFVDRVRVIIDETGADPEKMSLEITESLLLDNADSMIKLLMSFRDMGFGISIDDFGTGYSSLSYLKKLPINELKIDRSFVKDIATDLDDGTIAKAIISLAKNLHLAVVAEGVEEEAQLKFLLEEGCNNIQGFYFGKPVPPDELVLPSR